MIRRKLLDVSPIRLAERPKKNRGKLLDYVDKFRFKRLKVVLQDPDSDKEDQIQRKKVQQRSLQMKKEYMENVKSNASPRITSLEEQLTKYQTHSVNARSKNSSPTLSVRRKSFSSLKHTTICKRQHHKPCYYQTQSPILVTNAFKLSNKRSAPKEIKIFLSSLRFGSQELPSIRDSDAKLQIDSHLVAQRTETTFRSKNSRLITTQVREVKTALSFEQLDSLVFRRLGIDYRR